MKSTASTFLALVPGTTALCCLLGIASTFLTWSTLPLLGAAVPLRGIASWHGKGIALCLAALLAFVVAGAFRTGWIRWRPAATGAAGLATLVLAALYAGDTTAQGTMQVGAEAPTPLVVSVRNESGVYIALALGVVLLVLATIPLLRFLNRAAATADSSV